MTNGWQSSKPQLVGDSQVIVDIYSRYLFEKEVFERREKAELSADELCEIMVKRSESHLWRRVG